MIDGNTTTLTDKQDACPYNESSAFVAASFQLANLFEIFGGAND